MLAGGFSLSPTESKVRPCSFRLSKEKIMKNKILRLICILFVVVLSFSFTACRDTSSPLDDTSLSSSVYNLGEGDTEFEFTVVTADGNKKVYNIKTDEKTIGDALSKLNLIDGEEGQFGLYVKTVDSITYDYDKDGKYWAFYVNGEYASSGVDKTEIEKGSTYMFKAE